MFGRADIQNDDVGSVRLGLLNSIQAIDRLFANFQSECDAMSDRTPLRTAYGPPLFRMRTPANALAYEFPFFSGKTTNRNFFRTPS